MRGAQPAVTTTVVARGGAVYVPLRAERHGTSWPATVPIELADGRRLDGAVLWLDSVPRGERLTRGRAWSEPAQPLRVRAIAPDDDSSLGHGRVVVVAPLPDDAPDGAITVAGVRLETRWGDPARPYSGLPLPDANRPPLTAETRDDRPPPLDPFEHWRYVLLADRLDLTPPSLDRFDPLGALVAQYHADLWRIALADLAVVSPGVAGACRDLMTAIVRDGDHALAAWELDPTELLQLLFRARIDERAAANVLAWLQSRPALLLWSSPSDDERLELRVINRSSRARLMRWHWADVDDDTPLAVTLPGHTLSRIDVDRPPLPPRTERDIASRLNRFEAPPQRRLQLDWDLESVILDVGAALTPARPPGVFLPTFRPTLTLADVHSREQPAMPVERATSMQLRFRDGRWEIFFECRRPADSPGTGESVTLLLGPADQMGIALTIPEVGAPELRSGDFTRDLTVHRRSWPDRWYARVVVPGTWLEEAVRHGTLSIGAIRRHGDTAAVETTPAASVPWRVRAGRVATDLTNWD